MQNLLIFCLAIAHHIYLITNPNFRQRLTFFNTLSSIFRICAKEWTTIGQKNVILDYFISDWVQTLCIVSNETDKSVNFFDKFNFFLDLHGPNKELDQLEKLNLPANHVVLSQY